MKSQRFPTRLPIVAFIVLLAVVFSGCAPVRNGISWPALSQLELDGQAYILVTYDHQVELLEIGNGTVTNLRDADNEVLMDETNNPKRWLINGSEYENAQFFARPLEVVQGERLTLLFPTATGKLLSIYANDASAVNTVPVTVGAGVITEVAADTDLLYVPYRTQDLAAFDRSSYDELWRLDTESGVWAAPLLNEGILYVPSVDHHLYAVNTATGAVLWSVDLEGAVVSSPALHDGALYVGSYSHKLYKISLDGEILAEYEGNNWIWGTPAFDGDAVYFADLSGFTYALNASDLTLIWERKVAARGIRPAPLVYEDYVIVASRDGMVYWLNRLTGDEVFKREVEQRPEILSDLLLLEADEAAGIPETMVLVGSVNPQALVAAFAVDNSLPLWVHGR